MASTTLVPLRLSWVYREKMCLEMNMLSAHNKDTGVLAFCPDFAGQGDAEW